MKIRVITFSLFLSLAAPLYSQEADNQRPPLSQRIFFGSSLALQLGQVTNIDLAPVAGVWLLPRLNAAAGPSFQYYKDYRDQTVIFGGRAYSQFYLIRDFDNIIPAGIHIGLFIQCEYEGLSLEKAYFDDLASKGRVYQGAFFGGAGISEPMGQRSAVNVAFLWTLSNPVYDIYATPEVSITVIF